MTFAGLQRAIIVDNAHLPFHQSPHRRHVRPSWSGSNSRRFRGSPRPHRLADIRHRVMTIEAMGRLGCQ